MRWRAVLPLLAPALARAQQPSPPVEPTPGPAPRLVATVRAPLEGRQASPAVALSPDGRRVAYVDGGAVVVRTLDDVGAVTLPPFDAPVRELAWTADGRRIAAAVGEAGADAAWVLHDLRGGSREAPFAARRELVGARVGATDALRDEVTPSDTLRVAVGALRGLRWSPDGRRVAAVSQVGAVSQLWIVDADSLGGTPARPARVVESAVPLADLAWSADGRALACAAAVAGGPRPSLPCGTLPDAAWEGATPGGLALSPGATTLYYATTSAEGALEVRARALVHFRPVGPSRLVGRFDADVFAPEVAADGRLLVRVLRHASDPPSGGGAAAALLDTQLWLLEP